MAARAALDFVREAERASVLLHPLRLRIVAELREPDSASGLARRLRIPRQKINYHLRELEKERLVELVEERRKGNCTERIVRASARSYLIDPAALGALATDPNQIEDRFSSAYLVAVAARAIRDLAVLCARAEKAQKKLATFTLQTEVRFASAAGAHAFAEELANQLGRLIAKYHDEKVPGGQRFQVFLGSYPTPTKKEEPAGPSERKRLSGSPHTVRRGRH